MQPAPAPRPALEVADIVRAYRASHRHSGQQDRVLRAIEHCRTAALGGHCAVCDHCGVLQVSFNVSGHSRPLLRGECQI